MFRKSAGRGVDLHQSARGAVRDLVPFADVACGLFQLIVEDREYRGRHSAGCIDREGTL
jgi:hypothetical protein